jgi:cytochrome c biogenesis protein CcmG/thiol:disulfide interchange protein DsbE
VSDEPAEIASDRPRALRLALQAGAVAAVAALLVLLIWKLATDGGGTRFAADVREGRLPAAPAFSLPVIWTEGETWPAALRSSLDGGPLDLAELRGRPVVLNFWASWCGPCEEEAPDFAASAREHRGDVVFLGVDVEDLTSDARVFLREHAVPYPSVRDGSHETYDDFGLTGVPETFYLDAEGRTVGHDLGRVSRAELEKGIAAARGSGRS